MEQEEIEHERINCIGTLISRSNTRIVFHFETDKREQEH